MAKDYLKKKKVLLISVKFFNYEFIIKDTLEKMGAQVDLYDERPSNSFFTKAILRIYKDLYSTEINRYFRELLDKVKNKKYDYFLLIKGEATPSFFIKFLKENNPGIKLIYYTYDSFKNNSNGLAILEDFDYKFTFDSNDVKKYNMEFRPLFYAQDYSLVRNSHSDFIYDLCFIGTAHSDRYTISQKLHHWCNSKGFRMFNFYFSPSKLLFKFNKLFKKDFKLFDEKKISFNSLSHSDIIALYKQSRAVLDINHPGQNGLTMRTFETLGAGRKLITTNANVKKYPFYNESNVLVIDRSEPFLAEDFFGTSFIPYSDELNHNMSIEGWICDVFKFNERNIWIDVL